MTNKPNPLRVAQGHLGIMVRTHGKNSPEAIAAARALAVAKWLKAQAEADAMAAELDEISAAS